MDRGSKTALNPSRRAKSALHSQGTPTSVAQLETHTIVSLHNALFLNSAYYAPSRALTIWLLDIPAGQIRYRLRCPRDNATLFRSYAASAHRL